MKNLVILLSIVFLPFFINAQNNENKKTETTVEKVTVKDTDVETVVKKNVDREKSILKVEGTNETNQSAKEVKVVDEKVTSLNVDEEGEDNKSIDGVQRGRPTQALTKEVMIDGKKCKCICDEQKQKKIDQK